MTIRKQPWGSKIIIYIESDSREETAEKYYWFWHYSIASLEPDSERVDWVSKTAVRFFTTPEKYLRGVELSRLFYLIDNHGEDFKGAAALEELESTTGYKAQRTNIEFFGYDNGHGKAENLSDIDAWL